MQASGEGRRFFVRIEAADEEALRALQGYHLDVFRESAVRAAVARRAALAAGAGEPPAVVEGLLTMPEIERLVVDGYRVTLESEASALARGRVEVVEFEEWLKGREG